MLSLRSKANMMTINEITFKIRGAIFEVHNILGPGLLEKAYEEALIVELRSRGLKAEAQENLPIIYKGVELNTVYRLDIVVEDTVIIEVKSVEHLDKKHFKQLIHYLRLKNLYVGILVNFNCDSIDSDNCRRVYNSDYTESESLT